MKGRGRGHCKPASAPIPLPWPPACPLLILAGTRSWEPFGLLLPRPNDGKVSVAATHLPGSGALHRTLPATHTFIMRHPAVVRATLAFLGDA